MGMVTRAPTQQTSTPATVNRPPTSSRPNTFHQCFQTVLRLVSIPVQKSTCLSMISGRENIHVTERKTRGISKITAPTAPMAAEAAAGLEVVVASENVRRQRRGRCGLGRKHAGKLWKSGQRTPFRAAIGLNLRLAVGPAFQNPRIDLIGANRAILLLIRPDDL